jgi:hypothetical protein
MRRFTVVLLCLVSLLFSCQQEERESLEPSDREAFQQFLLQYHQRYPRVKAEDYYKLIFQSAFGIRHFIEDETSARVALEREIFALSPASADEPLLEPLDPEGRMVRVNLRPFVAQDLSRDGLVAAMLETAGTLKPDTTLFLGRWNALRDLVKSEQIPVPMDAFKAVDQFASERDYPAVRHSDDYRGAYKPAYRVVLKKLFQEQMQRSGDTN